MNSTKNTLKNKRKPEKKKSARAAQGNTLSTGKVAVIAAFAVLMILMAALVAWENLKPNYMINLDGKKYKEADLMYEIYNTEASYKQMEQMYAQFGYSSDDFWNYNDGNGTMVDTARSECQNAAIKQLILYDEAVKAGYQVTEEEIKQAKEDAKNLYKNLSEDQKKKTGFTKASLQETLKKYAVTDRYRKDQIESLNIDEAKIKEGVSYEDFREYQLEYFYIATTETDEEGETKEVSADEKQKARQKLEDLFAKAEKAEDWSKVIPKDEDAASGESEDTAKKEAEVSYGTSNLTKQDSKYSDDLTKKLMQMKNGDISEIVEEKEDGYYVFRMKENDSADKYDTEVENQITQAENEGFDGIYQKLYENHSVKIYEDAWKNLNIGSITQ